MTWENSVGLNKRSLEWHKLSHSFYRQDDVVMLARQLIGMRLVSYAGDVLTYGIITETEAYAGEADRASHAFNGRRTRRTGTMFRDGGIAYIYLCYGIHSLLNVVTNRSEIPHAVLIRGIYPLGGLGVMQERTGKTLNRNRDGSGPGKVTRLLGLDCSYDGVDLSGGVLWIEQSAFRFDDTLVKVTPRIGVQYAAADALLPYRFVVEPAVAAEQIKKAGLC